MASEKYSFWDSFAEALEPLDDATYGRIVRSVAHKVFSRFGNEDPDFSDNPMLFSLYTVIMRNSEESRDLFKLASENGKKARGVPKQRGAKGGLKGGQRGAKAKGKDMRGNESIDSFSPLATHTYPAGAPPAPADAGPVAPAPEPCPYPVPEPREFGGYPPPPPPPEP